MIRSDDDAFRIDAHFLGPRHYTLPFAARYVAWGLFFAGFAATMVVQRILHLGFGGPFGYFNAGIGGLLAGKLLGDQVSYERPLRAILAMIVHELRAPRPLPDAQQEFTVSLASVKTAGSEAPISSGAQKESVPDVSAPSPWVRPAVEEEAA
jgi:hypothetical protein